jgi:hypothetical protein
MKFNVNSAEVRFLVKSKGVLSAFVGSGPSNLRRPARRESTQRTVRGHTVLVEAIFENHFAESFM